VFILDWRDHPEKTQEWYDQRKAKAEREGMQHIFAQEVDRNYSAAVENTIISYEWITAAVDAHLTVPALAALADSSDWMAGLDVADDGADKNAIAIRQGFILRHARDWGERDPGVTTRNMLGDLRERCPRGIQVQYDSIGIGAAVKSEWNRLVESGTIEPDEFDLVPWNAGFAVVRPYERLIPGDDQTMMNRDFFQNFKAQAWWSVRTRFYKTWRAVTQGEVYSADELISIDGRIPCLHQLMKELAQPQGIRSIHSLKYLVDKSPKGTRSPNLADSLVACYFPAPKRGGSMEVGSYSG
jgi:phage terminase large subunit